MKQFGAFTLDAVNECLWRDGRRIPLPPKPFAVLRYLVENAGRLVSHDELLDALWPGVYVQPQVLRTYVLDLRRVLDDDARNPRYLQSLPKRGYCFVAEVTEAAQPRAMTAETAAKPAHSLAGRERELDLLHAALEKASAGERQVVFISGEWGIGKSALVDQFRKQVEAKRAATVGVGQCVPGLASRQEYYPLSDALRPICSDSDAPRACNLLHRGADSAHNGGLPHLLPGDVCAALEQIAGEKPLLLIVEDIQWADEPTLSVLSALARRHGGAKVLVLVTLTPQTGSTAHAVISLIHDLRMRRLCCEIRLARLGRSPIGELLIAELRQAELPCGLRDFVYQQSEGNPRFARTILEHLIAEEALVRSEGRWELRTALDESDAAPPGELARMVELAIENLDSREQKILEAASLAPVAFPAWLVAAAIAEDVASVEDSCEELSRRLSFVKRAGEDELPDGTRSGFYVFAHALYRDVLYQRQSPARRGIRHIRVAERLREMFRGRESLIARDAANHYQAAGDWPNAVNMLTIAAQRASAMRAFDEAAELEQKAACLRANLDGARQGSPAVEPGCEGAFTSPLDTEFPLTSMPAKA